MEETFARNAIVHVEDVLGLEKINAPYAQMSAILLSLKEMDVVFALEIQHAH